MNTFSITILLKAQNIFFVFLTRATLCIARSLRQRRVRLSVRLYLWHTPVLYQNEEICEEPICENYNGRRANIVVFANRLIPKFERGHTDRGHMWDWVGTNWRLWRFFDPQAALSFRFRDIWLQIYRGHDLDLLGSRDVIGHVTI